MSGGRKRILSPFAGRQKRQGWNKTREKYLLQKRRQDLAETDRGSYYNQKESPEEFLDNKDAFYDSTESDDIENADENDTEKIEAFFHRCS